MLLKKLVRNFYNSDSRTILIKKNIIGSFGLKSIALILDFFLVPLTLSYLTKTNYGVWLTINSIVQWFNLFDLGISHGFRNRISIAFSENDIDLAKRLTSTAYGITGLISIVLIIISLAVIPMVNWNWVFNYNANIDLTSLIQVVFISFSINFNLKVLTSIFFAKQMPIYVKLYELIVKTISFAGIMVLIHFTDENLYFYVSILSFVPVVILLGFNLFYFNNDYKKFKPSVGNIDFNLVSDIMGLGVITVT